MLVNRGFWVSKVAVRAILSLLRWLLKTLQKALENGMKSVDVFIKGPGAGREPAVRALAAAGLKVSSLRDITPIPS